MTDTPNAAVADTAKASLERDGYCVLQDALDESVLAALDEDLGPCFEETPFCLGDFYGASTKRFGGLLTRSPHAKTLVQHPDILRIAGHVLEPFCDRIALNLTQAVAIHPGAPAQYPHRDQDMWGGEKGGLEYLVNVMWPLTPFAAVNGGTRLWPGSHEWDDDAIGAEDEAIVPDLISGDALLFLGSTLHGGGANTAKLPRRGIIVSYCLGWLKPFELQWLVYPPHVARHFDPELAALVGYAQHRPNLGNVEGQCPSVLLGDDIPRHLQATDALRSDQAEALAEFLARQE